MTFFADTLVDASPTGTLLAARIPDTAGTSYEATSAGNNRLFRTVPNAGRIRPSAGATATGSHHFLVNPSSPSADYEVEFELVFLANPNFTSATVFLRMADATLQNGYTFRRSTSNVAIEKVVAGTANNLSGSVSRSMSANTTERWCVRMEGTTITASQWNTTTSTWDVVIPRNDTGTPHTAAGRVGCGLNISAAATDTDGTHLGGELKFTALNVGPPANLSVVLNPTSLSIQAGQSGTFQLSANRVNGFGGAVTLSLEGAPAGVTVDWGGPNPTGTGFGSEVRTVTLAVAPGVAVQGHPLTVRAAGSGVADATAALALTVQPGTTPTLAVGSVYALGTTVRNLDGSVNTTRIVDWTVDRPDRARLELDGSQMLLFALAPGEVVVTASARSGSGRVVRTHTVTLV